MEQEQINIEDIMQEIRAEIRAKGYEDNEIPFSDIACLVGGTEVPFDLKDYLDDISMMDESRTVLAYRDISSTRKGVGKLITFVKKVIRKMVCFYVEPLVDDQNRFNELTTRVVAQTVRRYNDDDARIEELEKKIYKCERRIRELEEELKKKFPDSFIDKTQGRVYLHLPVIKGNDHDLIATKLTEYYFYMKDLTDRIK